MSRLRLGGFWFRATDEFEEGFQVDGVPQPATVQALGTRVQGGGVLGRWVWSGEHWEATAGAQAGIGETELAIRRITLRSAGSFEEFARQIAGSASSDSWERDVAAAGPLLRLELGTQLLVRRHLALGLEAGWLWLVLPTGAWFDGATGSHLEAAPARVISAWTAAIEISLGARER
jgi:hypothetical protein